MYLTFGWFCRSPLVRAMLGEHDPGSRSPLVGR
jgi:hypothetical protein